MRLHFHRWAAALAAFSIPVLAAPVPPWRLTESKHFEIYAQTSDQRANAILIRLEQLRAFFQQQNGWKASSSPVRVIIFASDQPYRLRSTADAYYVGSGDRDYIVMAAAAASRDLAAVSHEAAHEYVHLVLRASNLQVPPWLKEGLAELYSTLRMDDRGTELGGPLPARLDILRSRDWMPLEELMAMSDASLRHQERGAADLFYAESWALTGMLALSPGYAGGFQHVIDAEGAAADAGLPSMDVLVHDLRVWVNRGASASVQLSRVASDSVAVEVSDVSQPSSGLLLAQLLLAAGEFDRA